MVKKIPVIFMAIMFLASCAFAEGVTPTAQPSAVKAEKKASKPAAQSPGIKPLFYRMNVEGIIDISNADYVVKGIEAAEKDGVQGVIITMQTPGGLDKSMRKICDKILNSKVPVITYIFPKGSRAASAGVFILLSSHIAAMAEGTNVGTAHPVDYQGNSVSEKITNDAVAYIKNLARMKGRNEQWAADAILKNISSSEIDALKLKAIDVTAVDMDDLMKKIDKKKIKVGETVITLNTANYQITDIKPSSKHRFLHYLSDPNVVYVLFMIGIYGLIYELANAGTVVFPGIAGAIAIVLAFTGFESLPINIAGVILIIMSALLFFIDIMSPTHGVLTAGGILSLIIGSLLLFPSRGFGGEWAVSYVLMGTMIFLTIAFFVLIVAAILKAHKKKTITGVQTLVGLKGIAISDITEDSGVINVGGEDWQAYSDGPIKDREIVEVLEVNGMKVKVKHIPRKKEL